jgi:hypothetical protein
VPERKKINLNYSKDYRKKEKTNTCFKKTCICLAAWRALRFSFSRQGAKTAKKAKNRYKTFFYLAYRFF